MLLCLDLGNTHLYAGIFKNNKLILRFRYPSDQTCTSDQIACFIKSVLRENKLDPEGISGVILSSVVPSMDYTINAACIKYFNQAALMLQAGVKSGLHLKIESPKELGADRIATAVAAIERFPGQNLIVADFGTATTLCAINDQKQYLGGAILPGFKLSMQALSNNTAKLATVDILAPEQALGKNTRTNLQSGIYYSQLGAVNALSKALQQECFKQPAKIIATGGYSQLLQNEGIFDALIPDLVLEGLAHIWKMNQ